MTGICEGRVVIVTGAARGIGRAHALEFARQGAKLVVNDIGAELDGTGGSPTAIRELADEIAAGGGEATVNGDDVADWDGARRLVRTALEAFGGLDVVVNNAGFVRDRMFVSCGEDEWDTVVRVHLKGHFAVSRFAAEHWRERAKAGEAVDARIVNTSSGAGLHGSVGQAAYSAAKAGIAALTLVQAAELSRYGVTANAIAPSARTRMTETVFADTMARARRSRGIRRHGPRERGAAGGVARLGAVGARHGPGLRGRGRQGRGGRRVAARNPHRQGRPLGPGRAGPRGRRPAGRGPGAGPCLRGRVTRSGLPSRLMRDRSFATLAEGGGFFEGPRWHHDRWWVSDFYRHTVFAIDPDGAHEEILTVEAQPSGLGWMPDGSLLVVSMKDRRVLRRWPDGSVTVHADLGDHCGGHANDIVIDARGHAYVGNFGFDIMAGAPPCGGDARAR